MKYIQEFRDKELVKTLVNHLKQYKGEKLRFMEVCGGHTMAVHKFGIPRLLPPSVKLISGPGCPVCVTSIRFIDHAVALSRLKNTIIATYGDLIRVPGSSSSLENEKSHGADVRMVYSTMEALAIARENPSKQVVFPGIGFETTTPASAVALQQAKNLNIRNFYLLSSHKIMPPAMEAIIDEEVKIDGYLAPGHVSTITGAGIYMDIPEKYGLPVVVSGFEPVDILQSIYMLVQQHVQKSVRVEIQYSRAVKPEGNRKAQSAINNVFYLRDDWWRGLGILKNSGYGIREEYGDWDAEQNIDVEIEQTKEPQGCICGEVLKGVKTPADCPLFAKKCYPSKPVGTCMVSGEGACQAYYRYGTE